MVQGAPPWGAKTSVSRLASLPGNPSVIFVGAGNAVYVSSNDGKTWQKGPAGSKGVGGIAAAGARVYAAVDDKVWVSKDGVRNWTVTDVGEARDKPISRLTAGAKGG